jgi:dTDP-4-dehydrorhamnose 3,5-epimerase
VAHGFQTLVDDTDVSYAMTEAYREELTRGVRYDDASFSITWPLAVSAIHERDRRYPDWDPS